MHNHIDMRKAAHVDGPVLWNEPDIADLQIPCCLDDQFEVLLNVAIGDHGFLTMENSKFAPLSRAARSHGGRRVIGAPYTALVTEPRRPS